MTAIRFVNQRAVVLQCKPPCTERVTIEHTASTIVARKKARLQGWYTRSSSNRALPDLCPVHNPSKQVAP